MSSIRENGSVAGHASDFAPVRIPRSETFALHRGQRVFQVYVAYPDGAPPQEGYPVLYVLDANQMFATAVETVRAYERRGDSSHTSAIVVGIGYPEGVDEAAARAYDLTPSAAGEEYGGADDFLEFLRAQLKPEIARRYVVNTSQEALFGHSFGGLFTVLTLTTAPDTFDIYIAASPSIWFNGRDILHRLEAFENVDERPRVRALLLNGGYERELRPQSRMQPDATRLQARLNEAAQLENAAEVARRLDALPEISAEHAVIEGEDHGTVIPAALSRAVAFLLMPAPAQ